MSVNNVSQAAPQTNGVGAGETGAAKKAKKTEAAKGAAAYKAAEASARGPGEAANVQISAKAKEMSKAMNAVKNAPDVREDKVEKYKAMIASGEYKPDAGKIADGIAKEALRDEVARKPEVQD